MKKLTIILLTLALPAISLFGGQHAQEPSELQTKELKVSVYTSQELADAILAGAQNLEHSTKILIHGELIGSFEVPQTFHKIILEGSGSGAVLNANHQNTTLFIDYGATVVVKNLTITGGYNGFGSGIYNLGTLEVFHCTVYDNSEAGILNMGKASIEGSSIENNAVYGIYNDFGNVKIKNSSLQNNSGYGILSNAGKIEAEKCTISNNNEYGIYNYYGSTAEISDCSIDDHSDSVNGYGIYNIYASTVTVQDTSVDRNSNHGIYNEGTTLKAKGCSINDNGGFGIYNYSYSAMKVHNSKINRNSIGGVYNNESTIKLSKCTLNNNSSVDSAGGLTNEAEGIATVVKCHLQGNSSETTGGAIYNSFLMTVKDSLIKGNTSDAAGGGIFNDTNTTSLPNKESSILIIRDSLIRGNTSQEDGGGVYNVGSATLISTKINENQGARGGGLANEDSGTLTLKKSFVTYNTATSGSGSGGGIYNTGSSLDLEMTEIGHNTPDQVAP